MKQLTFNELPEAVSSMVEKLERIEKMLQLNKSEAVHQEPYWMSLDELIVYIPGNPAKQTVYSWINQKVIPYHKTGKRLYFSRPDIDSWLKSGRRANKEDIRLETGEFLAKQKKGGGHVRK
jgi:excisionase family DNA binding protein